MQWQTGYASFTTSLGRVRLENVVGFFKRTRVSPQVKCQMTEGRLLSMYVCSRGGYMRAALQHSFPGLIDAMFCQGNATSGKPSPLLAKRILEAPRGLKGMSSQCVANSPNSLGSRL